MCRLNRCIVTIPFLLVVTGILKMQYSIRFTKDKIMNGCFDVGSNKSTIPSLNEYKAMAVFVQKRINEIQNPSNCKTAKKVVCKVPELPHGFGSQVHLFTICFTVGFMTGRTVILHKSHTAYVHGWESLILPFSNNCTTTMNQKVVLVKSLFQTEYIPVIKVDYKMFYLELLHSLPQHLLAVIKHFHSNPSLWWAGQIATYILRPNKRLKYLIAEKKKEIGFQNVILGLHVRRTDKKSEANYHNLTEYMKFAEKWYISYENTTGQNGVRRKIYLATDEPSVVIEAKRGFPNYLFINNRNATMVANSLETRYQYPSLIGIMLDTFLLSQCDYLVCTMSSNICRLAFELMQPRFIDASQYAHSLDWQYFIVRL